MAKDVLITPGSGLIDFHDPIGTSNASIQLDSSGNLSISSTVGDVSIGDIGNDVYIGDGVSNVDVIFEQNGSIRALAGKTLTLGQPDSNIFVNSNIGIGITNPAYKLDVQGTTSSTNLLVANKDYDYTNNGSVSSLDSVYFTKGLKHPDGSSISNSTDTAGIVFLEGDIVTEAILAPQYSGSFSIFTKNSTYDYCDNYINASPNAGMNFGSSGGASGGDLFTFFKTSENGNGTTITSVLEINSDGNLGVGITFPTQKLHVASSSIGLNDAIIGSILTPSITRDTASSVIIPPKRGGLVAITSFSTYPDYAQPDGTAIIYYDTGLSPFVEIMSTVASSNIAVSTTTYTGNPLNYTDNKITFIFRTDSIIIVNRDDSNLSLTFQLTFL